VLGQFPDEDAEQPSPGVRLSRVVPSPMSERGKERLRDDVVGRVRPVAAVRESVQLCGVAVVQDREAGRLGT
jgi:hypothetical protein